MSFLRRLLGQPAEPAAAGGASEPDGTATAGSSPEADEAARDRDLMLEEARRLDDDLIQRQLRYADRAWTPPPQGGPQRADDEGAPEA